MNKFEINPYIRVGMHSILSHNLNMRIILDYELLYLEDGELLLNYNGTPFHFHRGDILLLCPNIPHSFTLMTPEIVQPHIHFDLSYDPLSPKRFISFKTYAALTSAEQKLVQPNAFIQFSDSPSVSISDKETFLETFFSVIDSNNQHSLLCKSRMLEILNMIIEENALDTFHSDTATPNIVSLIKNYIDSNYEQDFRLSDLEKQFCYSRFYMDKLFRKEIGTSIIKYRNQLRLINAIPLLRNYSVSKTAQMLGFSSIYTFSHAFRAFYHDSPTEYLRKMQENE